MQASDTVLLNDRDGNLVPAKPVWAALLRRDLAALDLALSRDENPNEPHPYYGTPPLYLAINIFDDPQQRLEAVSSLLRAGADANQQGDESPLLFLALLAKDTAVMSGLLDHGADPNVLLDGWRSIYDFAEVDYRYQEYWREVPAPPSEVDLRSEEAWLEFLERLAPIWGAKPPILLRLLWVRGARPLLPLLERVSGSAAEQAAVEMARFQTAVDAARQRRCDEVDQH